MIIDCVSDLHGHMPELEGGDLLIVAGDLTASDLEVEYHKFGHWLWEQNYRVKIFIAGNHDGNLKQYLAELYLLNCEHIYLEDSGTEFEGLKIWGSPWTPPFCDWHFMLPSKEREAKWALIPEDTDILITHGPPSGILDWCYKEYDSCTIKEHCGCQLLRMRVEELNLKLHVFGHIHEHGGQTKKFDDSDTIFVNVSIMNEYYKPVNKPVRIIL